MNDKNWAQYTPKVITTAMRPYEPGEDVSHIRISAIDKHANGSPKLGDMIARNPKDHDDQWLVARKYFEDNLELHDPRNIVEGAGAVNTGTGTTYPHYTNVFGKDMKAKVSEWFDAELAMYAPNVVKLPWPTNQNVEHPRDCGGSEDIHMRVDGKLLKLSRVITNKYTCDVLDTRARPDMVITAVKKSVAEYVAVMRTDYINEMRVDAYAASTPTIYVKQDARNLEWFMYGYVGTLVEQQKDEQCK